MAVLVEAISVIIRADTLLAAFKDDWEAFKRTVPNNTLCADNEVVRVGFMTPTDVEAFVKLLSRFGLEYLRDGEAKDLVVVDQMRGPMAPCSWLEFGHINLSGRADQKIAACRLAGSKQKQIVMPEGWRYDTSLSSSFGFAPTQHQDRSLTFLRHENGMDVYRNEMTGEEIFVGRTSR